jgi:hypothetical protein
MTATMTTPLVRTGFAIVTITSRQTGEHLTYRVRECQPWTGRDGRERPGVGYWIDLRSADQDWTSCGKLDNAGALQPTRNATDDRLALHGARAVGIALTHAPRVDEDDEVPAVEWEATIAARAYGLQLEDRCRRCGDALTDPDSIRSGLGPYCEEQVTGVRRKRRSRRAKTAE